MAGDKGTVAVRWHDGTRFRLAIGYVGEDGIEPNTPYVVHGGRLVRKSAEAALKRHARLAPRAGK